MARRMFALTPFQQALCGSIALRARPHN
jgi:hypothetical protein